MKGLEEAEKMCSWKADVLFSFTNMTSDMLHCRRPLQKVSRHLVDFKLKT